jgi:hypothetical protein
MKLKQLIREHLLLEKRIGQLVDTLEVTMSFDLIKHMGHAEQRSMGIGREKIEDYDMRPVTNMEIRYFIDLFKRDIAEKILTGEIKNEEPFVIRSSSKGLAIPLKPIHNAGTNWKLVVLTVWRESNIHKLKTFEGQVIIEK